MSVPQESASGPLAPVFREPASPEPAPASPESPFQEATPEASASGEPASPAPASASPAASASAAPPLIIVDGANVVGSVPDGWWRDRAGAAIRLRDHLAAVPAAGLGDIPAPVEVVLVVEGKARDIPQGPPEVRIERAAGSGDDKIIDLVRREHTGADHPGQISRRVVVITADRGLRERALALAAEVRGPSSVPR